MNRKAFILTCAVLTILHISEGTNRRTEKL